MGTLPLYYLTVALYRLPTHLVLIGSAAMLWGYLRSWLAGSRACPATTTWSSGVSSNPTSTHACAWESGPPRPEWTLSGRASGTPPTRLPSLAEGVVEVHRCTEKAEPLGLSFDAVTIETAVARCLEFW